MEPKTPQLMTTKTFSFDRKFQDKIVQAMLWDKTWAGQFAEVLEVGWFEHQYLTLVASTYMRHWKEYKTFPSMDLLVSMLKEHLKAQGVVDQVLRSQVAEFLKWVVGNPDLEDLKYVQDTSMDWCRRQALKAALEESCDLVFTDKYESVVNVIKKALAQGTTSNCGLSLVDDLDARYDQASRLTIPTGVPELDQRKILNGGLAAGEIGIVVAPSGVGKSQLMVAFGAHAILQGKNVMHYTFELRDNLVGIRYDSHLTGIPSLECWENKEEIRRFYQEEREQPLGRLWIKEFPTSTATCNTLRAHLDKLAVTTGFRPDLLIVDYMGIMRSTDKYDAPRLELKRIAEELRAMSSDLNIPVWTCVQSNKDGANSETIDSTNLAESYAQAHVADVILTLQRKSSERATGFGNLFVAKNRAGIDGILFQIHLDTARSRIRVLTDDEAIEYDSIKNRGEQDDRERAKASVSAALKRAMKTHQDETHTLSIEPIKNGNTKDSWLSEPLQPPPPQPQ